jgi:hypothetical protein
VTSPLVYEIRVDGHLDDHWAAWLSGVRVAHADDGTTTLTLAPQDEAAVHAVLTSLRDMGARLLSLHVLDLRAPRAVDAPEG